MSSKNRQAFKKQEDYVEFKLEHKRENRKKNLRGLKNPENIREWR